MVSKYPLSTVVGGVPGVGSERWKEDESAASEGKSGWALGEVR